MESSPLAAMQPPPLPQAWGCRRDLFSSGTGQIRRNLFGTNNFNFRDLSMVRSQSDYFFSGSHIRGSSPAASLAADLSQNCHIDQSPQLPTPRRSLFTSSTTFHLPNHREDARTPPVRREPVTTPPIPSSSPGFNDCMDMSPLPHKAPFSRTSEVAPTPDTDTTLDEEMSSPVMTSDSADTQSSSVSSIQERRKPILPRPSLLRSSKFFSTNSVLQQIRDSENRLPPFKFGTGMGSVATAPSLDDIEDSPVQHKSAFEISKMGPLRPRQASSNILSGNRLHGSPLAGLSKKSYAIQRPRKLFRRSNSMFEHPGDVMKQEKKEFVQCGLQSIMDIDDTHKLALPHFIPADSRDGIPRITQETMILVLDGRYRAHYDDTMVVDCRFEYEYHGGHIDGAVNHNDKEGLARDLFKESSPQRKLLILHCEFSAHRAPLMAEHIRRQDRRVNEARYPKLTYPEVYILDGGYHAFFQKYNTRCFPQSYVEMDAQGHEATCEREMDKLRRRGKLNRATTYAFGEQDLSMEDSPTANGRTVSFEMSRTSGAFALEPRNVSDSKRSFSRRMASY